MVTKLMKNRQKQYLRVILRLYACDYTANLNQKYYFAASSLNFVSKCFLDGPEFRKKGERRFFGGPLF